MIHHGQLWHWEKPDCSAQVASKVLVKGANLGRRVLAAMGINFEAVLKPVKASAEQGAGAVSTCCSLSLHSLSTAKT